MLDPRFTPEDTVAPVSEPGLPEMAVVPRRHKHHRKDKHRDGVKPSLSVDESNRKGHRSKRHSSGDNLVERLQQQPSVGGSLGYADQQQFNPAVDSKFGDLLGRHHHRRRHHHHHHHRYHGGTTGNFVDGLSEQYGHLGGDMIFIERSERSPHRQTPPQGYELRGRIEVPNITRKIRSHSQGRVPILPPPLPPPPPPNPCACPPGYQAVFYPYSTAGPCGSAAPCGTLQPGYGYSGGVSSLPIPASGQLIADYIVESAGSGYSVDGGYINSGRYGYGGGGYGDQFNETVEVSSGPPTFIEVWQKRHVEPERRSRSSSRSSSAHGPSFDFERFRLEIMAAIERVSHGGAPATSNVHIDWHGGEGRQGDDRPIIVPRPEPVIPVQSGEVRVIVQPIQPVFFMPQPGPAPQPQIQTIQTPSAPNVVYVPRNVYVPVVKPVFVPKERVIVRPQIVHVNRPVVVDRPVPVTQRPIVIDRERPIPVPVRAATGSNLIREEYVYRDNLPVAYGARCPEYAGGVSYGYMPTLPEHQYATGLIEEVTNFQPAPQPVIDMVVPNQYQQTYANVTDYCTGPQDFITNNGGLVEVLDTNVNQWRPINQSALNQYGLAGGDIIQKTNIIEQKVFPGLRRNASFGIPRSSSGLNFVTGPGAVIPGGYHGSGGHFSTIHSAGIQNPNLGGAVC